jgi:hypothetical protein
LGWETPIQADKIPVWKGLLQRAVGFQELHLEMDAWAGSTGHLTQAPKYQVFPKQEKSNLIQRKYLELSSIFVPENEVNEQLFLHAILEFKMYVCLLTILSVHEY